MSISAQMHKALFIQTNSLQKIQLGSHQAPIGMIKSSWDAIISVGWKFIPVEIPVSIIPVTVYEVIVDLKLSSLK